MCPVHDLTLQLQPLVFPWRRPWATMLHQDRGQITAWALSGNLTPARGMELGWFQPHQEPWASYFSTSALATPTGRRGSAPNLFLISRILQSWNPHLFIRVTVAASYPCTLEALGLIAINSRAVVSVKQTGPGPPEAFCSLCSRAGCRGWHQTEELTGVPAIAA